MPVTTRLALPYPAQNEAANVPLDMQELADALDLKVSIYAFGTAAARPVTGTAGQFYRATDTGVMSFWDTAWRTVSVTTAAAISYAGASGMAATDVEAAIDELAAGKLSSPNTQTNSYSLVLADQNKTIEMNVVGANNLTVPTNATQAFTIGTLIHIAQLGAGQTTLVPAGGVTLRAYNANLKLAGQYAMATLIKRATDEWWAGGNLVP